MVVSFKPDLVLVNNLKHLIRLPAFRNLLYNDMSISCYSEKWIDSPFIDLTISAGEGHWAE